MLKFRRRRPPDDEPTVTETSVPPQPQMTVYVQHRDHGGHCVSRFHFEGELLRSDNQHILEELADSFELLPDTCFRPGVRFYRHHVSVSWYPEAESRDYERAILVSLMCNVLSEVFVMDATPVIIQEDPDDPLASIEQLVSISMRLGVDWGPTSFQP